MNPLFYQYKVDEIKYNLDHPLLDTDEKKKKILELLPKEKIYKISFILHGINSSISNYIRTIAIDELLVKKLDISEMDVDTKYLYIIPDEIKMRLNYTPLHQDIPKDSVFSISYVNNSNSDYVYTNSITGINDKYIHKSIRLAEIPKGHYLTINNIKITEGYGYEHSAFSITSNFSYKTIDYIKIIIMTDKLNTKNIMCKTSNILKLIESGTLKKGKNEILKEEDIENKIIIQITQENYDNTPNVINLNNYDYVIIGNIESESCMLANPANYKMSFIIQGVYDNDKFIIFILDTILNKLQIVYNQFTNNDVIITPVSIIKNNIVINDTNIFKVKIPNARKSLIYIIYYECCKSFPEIQSIKYGDDFITIRHNNYKKIIITSIENLTIIFGKLLKSFNKIIK